MVTQKYVLLRRNLIAAIDSGVRPHRPGGSTVAPAPAMDLARKVALEHRRIFGVKPVTTERNEAGQTGTTDAHSQSGRPPSSAQKMPIATKARGSRRRPRHRRSRSPGHGR